MPFKRNLQRYNEGVAERVVRDDGVALLIRLLQPPPEDPNAAAAGGKKGKAGKKKKGGAALPPAVADAVRAAAGLYTLNPVVP